MAKEEALEKPTVYKCYICGGSGKIIVDWDAYNNSLMPPGLSFEMARRNRRLREQAFGTCSKCEGRGFILKPKN